MTAPRHQVIAACAYPVEDNMAIDTQGTRAVAIRKMMLEFMLARCPTSEVIRSLATEAGVTSARFTSEAQPDELCVLCGLCVRVCRDLVGAAAIGFIGRGADREVGSPFHLQAGPHWLWRVRRVSYWREQDRRCGRAARAAHLEHARAVEAVP
jgi:ferredoxin